MEEDMHGGRGPEEVLVLALQGRGHLGSAGMKCTIPLNVAYTEFEQTPSRVVHALV